MYSIKNVTLLYISDKSGEKIIGNWAIWPGKVSFCGGPSGVILKEER